MNLIPRLIASLLAIMSFLAVHAQELNSYRYLKNLSGEALDVLVETHEYPEILKAPSHGSIARYKINSDDQYRVRYRASSGFIGLDTVIYKVIRKSKGSIKPYFEGFVVEVRKTLASDDYYIIGEEDQDVFLPVLSNDKSLGSEMQVTELSLVSSGSAQVDASGGGVVYTPAGPGISHIRYLACSGNSCAPAQISIRVNAAQEIPRSESVRYHIMRDETQTLLVPPGFNPPADHYVLGSVEKLTEQVYRYKPAYGFTGSEVIEFSQIHDGDRIIYGVSMVVEDPFDGNGWVHDDRVFTEVDNEVWINPSRNDLSDGAQLIPASVARGQVVEAGGQFLYTPPKGFEGRTTFDYLVCSEGRCDTGEVEVIVFNFAPEKRYWKFFGAKNQILPITYDVPIDAYRFEVLSQAGSGMVTVAPDGKEISYMPASEFSGIDAFQLSYCTLNDGVSNCETIDVQVDVRAEINPAICGLDCVWPGDLNADGAVDVDDVMPLGANLGARGPASSRGDLSEWYGRSVQDWPEQIAFGPSNLKHVDADGNGTIAIDDIDLISHFYGRTHQLVPSVPPFGESISLDLKLLTPEVEVGEEAVVEVSLRNNSGEFLQLVGVSFSFEINGRFADSSTFNFIPDPDGIFDPDVAVISYFQSPEDGRLDIGVVQTARKETPAHGVLGQVTFIVEEDLNGFRSIKDWIRMRMDIQRIHLNTWDGLALQLDEAAGHIHIHRQENEPIEKTELRIFPNPASDRTVISHSQSVNEIRLYSLQGTLLRSWNTNHDVVQLDLSEISTGLYILEVVDEGGTRQSRKIQVQK